MKKTLKIYFFLLVFLMSGNFLDAQIRYVDTATVSWSIHAKGGIIYDYPWYDCYADLAPVGEVGAAISFEKVQISLGIGYFPNNTRWFLGADNFSPPKRGTTQGGCMFMPLHANFKLFQIKRNLLTFNIGFTFLLSTPTQMTETTLNPGNEVTTTYFYTQPRPGLSGNLGFKYSRWIGKKFLVGGELGLNASLVPAMIFGTDYTFGFNMLSRQPNGYFKICFEYMFGKKHPKFMNETVRKKKEKKDKDVEDED